MLEGLAEIPAIKVIQPRDWYRVHSKDYPALSFNPSLISNARFSPFPGNDGTVVASLYAGSSVKAALMETVFHEVPAPSAKAILLERNIIERKWVRTDIASTQPLSLVDLTSVGLRRIGLSRQDVIDTNSDRYPITQGFARELYQHFPHAHGICWVSRLYDEGTCIVLYEDRIEDGTLVQTSSHLSVLADPTMSEILDLVDQLGMNYVPV
jgi:hypothetical protein